MICEQKTYIDDKGLCIYGLHPLAGGAPTFTGAGVLNYNTPEGVEGSVRFQFEVPGATIEEAFAMFPTAFERAKKKAEADLRTQYEAALVAKRRQLILGGSVREASGKIH